MKTLGIVQARMNSSRLPGKAMINLGGMPSLGWVVRALTEAHGIDQIMVATTDNDKDEPIVNWAKSNTISVFRGSENDVLSRYMGAARETRADIIIRTTADCPLIDPHVISQVIALRSIKGVMYATNTDPGSWPDGQDVEAFTYSALEIADKEATRLSDRECVTRFMVRNRHRISAANLDCPLPGLHAERWVLDSPEDLEFILRVVDKLETLEACPSYLQILDILNKNPDLRAINAKFSRNERFYEALVAEKGVKRSYSTSKKMLERAERTIPLGAQTYSKSKLQFPEGQSPLFVTHGDGGYVFDVDGNDYVDLVGGLLPNVLGYRDPDVDAAIRDQLSRGISFSLATTLEADLSELLAAHIPSCEMVRFGKNGSDVTTAAIRLARHVTGRKQVIIKGYHGWHSWTATNNAGITAGEQEDCFRLEHNEYHPDGRVAAVIVEPEFFTIEELNDLRNRCETAGTLLIFDEIITGFRCGIGGIQGLFNITPDLSTFGKAMANGMPISALAGKAKYMKRMTEISYSGTFFGETLSIAAAIATINKLIDKAVPNHLYTFGLAIRQKVNELIAKHQVRGIELYSYPELNRIRFVDKTVQGKFIQEMAKNGVLIIGSHNTCFAHKETELQKIIQAWDLTLEAISKGVTLEGEIKGKAVR